jgi:formate dehydrogenase subunit gamma
VLKKICLALILGALLLAAQAADKPVPAVDATTEATPYSAEAQKSPPSEAMRRAESGATHYTQSRNREAGVFQQAEGQKWRTVHNGPVTFYGGWLLVLVPLLILGYYAIFGPMRVHDPLTGRMMQRFETWERYIHWTTAICFVTLGLTGIIILFGKHIFIPVIGHEAFSWVAVIAKNLHNLVGPLFFVSIVMLFRRFVKYNLWQRFDWQWLLHAPSILRGKMNVPSDKFNAAEKMWFWMGVCLFGLIVSLSGFVLDFPNFEQGRHAMQIANLIHGIGAILFISAAFGHIYMGTIGAEGAFKAMQTGMVDQAWAKEHHELWYEKEKSKP